MSGAYTRITRHPRVHVREKTKIIFQYTLMVIAAAIAGWLLPRFFGDALWQKASQAITAHFSLPFSALEGIGVILQRVYSYFKPTLLCIILVAVFSFSSLSCLVTDCVLIYLGMRVGCSLSVLSSLAKGATIVSSPPGTVCRFLFVVFQLLLVVIFWLYSLRAAKYSYELRVYSKEGRALLPKKAVGALLLYTTLYTIMLFLLHALYGYSIYLVSK